MLTALRRPDRLKYIVERLRTVGRPARLKYTAEWFRTISAGAILLGLLSPDLVGARVWLAFLVIGLPTGLIGFWLIGKAGDK